jgi:hypothetical protein
MITEGRVSPLSDGTQFEGWLGGSCDRCAMSNLHNRSGVVDCPLQAAPRDAAIGDGTVDAGTAARLGVQDNIWSDWRCAGFIPVAAAARAARDRSRADDPGQRRLF